MLWIEVNDNKVFCWPYSVFGKGPRMFMATKAIGPAAEISCSLLLWQYVGVFRA